MCSAGAKHPPYCAVAPGPRIGVTETTISLPMSSGQVAFVFYLVVLRDHSCLITGRSSSGAWGIDGTGDQT